MRSRRWTLITVLLGLFGLMTSTASAKGAAQDRTTRERVAFELSADEVATALKSQVQQLQQVLLQAQAFFRLKPDATTSTFRRWADEVELFERAPAIFSIGAAGVYTHDQLPAIWTKLIADPPGGNRPLALPTGSEAAKSVFCIAIVALQRTHVTVPSGQNVCPNLDVGMVGVLRSMDRSVVAPRDIDGRSFLTINTPVYRTPDIPATADEREAQFLFHLGMAVDPVKLMRSAIEHHDGFVADLSFDRSGAMTALLDDASYRTGPMPSVARVRRIDVGNGWRIAVGQRRRTESIFRGEALKNLLVGYIISLLVPALLWVLATGRLRALRMVAEKTEELRHQALHDPLTGLANRTLLHDRIEQLLARSRRSGAVPACLFVDLDGFKRVNDSLGHEAGDLLLVAVASRLNSNVREADTIARIGGDEFVILLDGATLHDAPDSVGSRLVHALRQPFEIAGSSEPVRITGSVGVATGSRLSAGDLVRDADVALYRAKGAGRNQVVVFDERMHDENPLAAEHELDMRVVLHRQ